jgi:ABC-type transport system involved in multi-copper enzyme maturation permease subunit
MLYFINQATTGAVAESSPPEVLRERMAVPAFEYLGVQLFFSTFFTAIAGGPVVAEDLRRHALELYFSKPVRPIDYAAGKWCGVFRGVATTTVAPAALAAVFLFAFASGGYAAYGDLVWRGLAAATFASAVFTTVVLGVSAAGRSGRYAVVLWFVISFFTHLASKVLVGATGDGAFAAVSFRDQIRVVAARIMDVPWDPGRPGDEPPGVGLCLSLSGGYCLLAAVVLARRLRKAAVG